MNSLCRFILVVSLMVAGSSSCWAAPTVLLPTDKINGLTQAQLSVVFWQTMTAIPASSNPITDTTGAFAQAGNLGSVFLLAGSTGPTPVTRSVTVLSNQTLFFPLINTISGVDLGPAYGTTEAQLRQDVSDPLGIDTNGKVLNTTTLFATLNGTALVTPNSSLFNYREVSPAGLFSTKFPANDLFGLGIGPITEQAVSDGWYLGIAPLAPGTYTLHFGGNIAAGLNAYSTNSFGQDITYRLTVSPVPEPASIVAFALAGLCGLGIRNKRRFGL